MSKNLKYFMREAAEVEKVVTVPAPELSLIHISEPTRRTPISYAVFCLKKKNLLLEKKKPISYTHLLSHHKSNKYMCKASFLVTSYH